MSFTSLLIQTCTIQSKSLSLSGYEKVEGWANIATLVPTRKDRDNGASITDGDLRQNTDDDMFFFLPGVVIARGNRILLLGDYYDVIKVNKVLDSVGVHHLEVKARFIDHA